MHITAVRELPLQPRDIALLTTGELLAFSWSTEGMQLDAYDADLALLWSRKLGAQALGLRVDQAGVPWVPDRTGASAFSRRGDIDVRVDAPPFKGMEVAALTFVDDELVFAYQHAASTAPDRPALARVKRNGAVCWSATLSSESITFEGSPRDLPTVNGGNQLLPSSWTCGYLRAGDLTISGDTVLAVYSDMPRTGLGIGYAVALTDGALRYTTQRGPIHSVKAWSPGAFLVGYMGYGLFETV